MKISTPGRICLFGEHQDYLGLPVIAAAISKRVSIEGGPQENRIIEIDLPNISSSVSFAIEDKITYIQKRDYFRSAVNILQRMGYTFSKGIKCEVTGNIPINSGTSSSSALLCTWVHFLLKSSDQNPTISTKEIAEIAYQSEVIEFNEAGGMMDQYSTAVGDIIYLESVPKIHIEFLKPSIGTFVLGDSLEPKDTQKILSWVKYEMLAIIDKIKEINPEFSLHNAPADSIESYKYLFDSQHFALLKGNISDRDILIEAKELMQSSQFDDEGFGNLLNKHQDNLRDAKKISTPKIDRMINAALEAGAKGAKINGSGGGGCMFAYAPKNPEKVAEAIEKEGGKAYIITITEGSRIEN
ncbi:MAG: galactokinase family protein [Bacteroidota bacterium]